MVIVLNFENICEKLKRVGGSVLEKILQTNVSQNSIIIIYSS